MQAKKRIKICFILSIIVLVLNALVLVLDFIDDVSTMWKVLDALYLVTAIISVVGFAIFHFKPLNFAIKNKKWFIGLVCISCISSLILGYISLIAVFDLNYVKQKSKSDNTVETSGEVLPTYEEIVSKIKQLDELKKQNLITEEEYNQRKQAILDTIVKK